MIYWFNDRNFFRHRDNWPLFKENHRIVEIACIETNELIPTKKNFS